MAMDEIQTVDCFERLRRHLLFQDPTLDARFSAPEPDGSREGDVFFFLSHLVSLETGLDASSAEGRRRIRRIVMDLGDRSDDETAGAHLVVCDSACVDGLDEKRRERLVRSMRDLRKALSGEPTAGRAFKKEMERAGNLPDRVAWVRRVAPCPGEVQAYRYLNRVGYPVAVPDRPCQTFLFRLGLLDETGSRRRDYLAAAQMVGDVSRLLKRSPREVSLWIQAFAGGLDGVADGAALCRRTPSCSACPLQASCAHFRHRRPRASGSTVRLSVKQWRPKERPRERLMQHGASALEDAELLAIVLRTGSGEMNVIDLSRALLGEFGDLQGIEEATLDELQRIPGIGPMKAVELKAVFELGKRLVHRPFQPGDAFTSSADVFRWYCGRFTSIKQEEFILLMLNKKNQVIRDEVISRGGLDMSVVHPREVFKAALRASAASVIFVHNHPSGDPKPSRDDIAVTRRLREAGRFLQIEVLDHVIVGDGTYYSFLDEETIEGDGAKETADA